VSEPHRHVVTFYENDDDLIAAVVPHLALGLHKDAVTIVIATAAHRRALEEGLSAVGIDVEACRTEGDYLGYDAEETLAQLLIDGRVDEDRCREVLGAILTAASRDGRPVRAFGEMVGLLWDKGEVTAAIDLESQWNNLRLTNDFSLYCGYPAATLAATGDLAAARCVCHQHSQVIASPSYVSSGPGEFRPERPTEEHGDEVQRSRFFVPVPLAVGAVRSFVRDTLVDWGEDQLVPKVVLVLSELATNALLHASSPFRVRLSRSPHGVTAAVEDADPAAPHARITLSSATNGRGLAIVSAMARQWGTDLRPTGKTVWAEFDRRTVHLA
jgi:hypothetical protein